MLDLTGCAAEQGILFQLKFMGEVIIICIKTLVQGIKIKEIVWNRVIRSRCNCQSPAQVPLG